LRTTKGYDINVGAITDGRSFCVTLRRNNRIADLWIEVASNLGEENGEVKRELSLITSTKPDPIKTPVNESELINELLGPLIEATQP
jgi:hypothetical protein